MSRGLRAVLLAGHVQLHQRGCFGRLDRSAVCLLPAHCHLLRHPWQRALRAVIVCLLPSGRLLGQGSCLELHLLSTDDLAGVVDKSVHEGPRLATLLRPGRLLGGLPQLLELKPLQVDLLEVLHLGVTRDALEGALGEVREAGERLNLKVASVNKLIDIFFVELFELVFERPVVLRQPVLGPAVQVLRVLGQACPRALVICKNKL